MYLKVLWVLFAHHGFAALGRGDLLWLSDDGLHARHLDDTGDVLLGQHGQDRSTLSDSLTAISKYLLHRCGAKR